MSVRRALVRAVAARVRSIARMESPSFASSTFVALTLVLSACGQVIGLGDERTFAGSGGGDAGGEADAGKDAADAGDGRIYCSGRVLWAKRFGDASSQLATSMDSDGAGGVFIAGYFEGALDLGKGPLISQGGTDAFLARVDADGNVVWNWRFGGTEDQLGFLTVVATTDGVILSGEFRGTVDFGDGDRVAGGAADGFLSKYDLAGNHLWLRTVESVQGSEAITNVAVDANGSLYTSAVFLGNVSFEDESYTSQGMKDGLVRKLDFEGNELWTQQFGAVGDDPPNWIAADGSGRLLLGGTSNGDVSMGQEVLPKTAGYDVLLGVYQSQAGSAIETRRYGGSGDTDVTRVLAEPISNDVLVSGRLRYGATVNMGGNDLHAAEGAFLARFTTDLEHVASRGIEGFLRADGLAADTDGNVFVGGTFQGGAPFGSKVTQSHGKKDGVVMRLGPNLETIWTLQLGSEEDDELHAVTVSDNAGYAVGNFRSTATLDGCPTFTSAGGSDLVLFRFVP